MYGELEFYKVVTSSADKSTKKVWCLFLISFCFLINTCFAQSDPRPPLWTLNANSKLSIAFASQNNHQPESAFGHVFLVVHQQDPPEPNAKVIEFVGRLDSFGDMLATIHDKVDGRYRVLEFSEKSLDYDLENRDLYLLELKVEARQIKQLLAGMDDRLGRTYPYTFAKYNCAYYLALLLEEQNWLRKNVSDQTYVEPASSRSLNEGAVFVGRQHRFDTDGLMQVRHASINDVPIQESDRESCERLIDAEVKVRGVCTTQYNRQGQLIRVAVQASTMADIQVTKPSPSAPDAGSTRPPAMHQ